MTLCVCVRMSVFACVLVQGVINDKKYFSIFIMSFSNRKQLKGFKHIYLLEYLKSDVPVNTHWHLWKEGLNTIRSSVVISFSSFQCRLAGGNDIFASIIEKELSVYILRWKENKLFIKVMKVTSQHILHFTVYHTRNCNFLPFCWSVIFFYSLPNN